MNEMSMLILFGVIFVPAVVITAFTPYLVRKTESFGVSIPSEVFYSSELKAMRKQFATICLALGLAVLAGFFLFFEAEEPMSALFIVGYVAAFFAVYVKFHFRMKALKREKAWHVAKKQAIAVDLKFHDKKPTYPNGWFAIGLLIWAATVIFTFLYYDQIPDRIPMQYDLEGNVTNWMEKSYGSVLALPLVTLILTGVFMLVNSIIARSKQQLDPSDPATSAKNNLIFRRRWSAYTIISGHALIGLFSLMHLSFIFSEEPVWLMVALQIVAGGMIIGAVVLSVTTGQGGSRIRKTAPDHAETINRDHDRYWILGVFYFNPEDPALWVEKRFGIGWSMNFARPLAWMILIGILASVFLPMLLMRMK